MIGRPLLACSLLALSSMPASALDPWHSTAAKLHAAPVTETRSLVGAPRFLGPAPFFNTGSVVAIDGNTAVVGSAGAAFVLRREPSGWVLQQQLTPSNPGPSDFYGSAVGIAGERILVGAQGRANARGAVFAYRLVAGVWTEQQQILAPDGAASEQFGSAIAMFGDTALIGALADDNGVIINQGSAYAFTNNGADWEFQQKLSDSAGSSGDVFGSTVAVSGNVALIGAPLDDTGAGLDVGSALLFTRNGTVWTAGSRLEAPAGSNTTRFASALALAGNSALIQAKGVGVGDGDGVFAFEIVAGNASQTQRLASSDGIDSRDFGRSISIAGSHALIGSNAPFATQTGLGAAYLFERVAGVWIQRQKVVPRDGMAGDQFSNAVALGSSHAVIGALSVASGRGAAYFYDRVLFASDFEATAPLSVSLNAIPNKMQAGASATLGWSTTNTQTGNPTPCTRTGTNGTGWANGGAVPNQPANNPVGVQITIPTNASAGQIFDFSLTCLGNEGATVQATRRVTVIGSACPDPNADGLLTLGSPSVWPGSFRSISGFNAGNSFPLQNNQCAALAFNSGQIGTPPRWTAGNLDFFTQVGFVGSFSMSISRCPCDFRAGVLNTPSQTCRTTFASGKQVLPWVLVSEPTATPGRCPIAVNTDYFVNFTFGPGIQPNNVLGSCQSGECRVVGVNRCVENCP